MPGVCARCLREVYFAEEKLALGKVWHTFCFSCRNCRKLLDSWTVATHSGELFCRNCYNRLYSTTSVKPTLPIPITPIYSTFEKKNSAVSPRESLSDCCCCCYDDSCAITDVNDPALPVELTKCPFEKRRLCGGGGPEDEPVPNLERSFALCCDPRTCCSAKDTSELDLRNSQTTICDQSSSPPAIAALYNRHHSVSQSTFSRPSSAHQNPLRPSSTPAPGKAPKICINCNSNCSGARRPGSPCRLSHKPCEHSKEGNRHHCHEYKRSDRHTDCQELKNIAKLCQGRNFVQNYQNHLRSQKSLKKVTSRVSSITEPRDFSRSFFDPSIKSLFVIIAKNPVIIDSSRQKIPCDYPHSQNPPSACRRKVVFSSSENILPPTCYPEMQNIADDGYSKVDAISFENCDNNTSRMNDFGAVESYHQYNEDSDDSCDQEEYVRIRGGCGGGGGSSGCCCSSGAGRSNAGPEYANQSSHGSRYQVDRSATPQGGCGCSGHGKSGFGGGAQSAASYGSRHEANSHRSPRIGGCCKPSVDERSESVCASKGGYPMNYDKCPPSPPDACAADPSSAASCSTVACSPPCADRKGCCPPAGCRPVRRKVPRCNTPCTGDTQSCGGGGSCGGGCRGGCGIPGQICLPLRSCTIPPCQPHITGRASPCLPPRSCSPQPPCCRVPAVFGARSNMSGSGKEGGSSCCRSASPGGRSGGGGGCGQASAHQDPNDVALDSCCQPKLPAGCECLGGGQDCQRCGRKVYHAEMQIISGVPYHNICFSCFCCRKPLETLTYHENCGEIYCKQCYVRNFGPQGYGYSGVLQTPM